jgi:CheY-like chemotaxis protein
VIKILYVEDNDDNIYMLKMRLELEGDFEVLVAENGERGCEMAASEPPDIILMDLSMPEPIPIGTRAFGAHCQEATSPPSHAPAGGVVLFESCQRDVPKSCFSGSADAVGRRAFRKSINI